MILQIACTQLIARYLGDTPSNRCNTVYFEYRVSSDKFDSTPFYALLSEYERIAIKEYITGNQLESRKYVYPDIVVASFLE